VSILLLLIPLSLLLMGVAAAMFIWAVDNDQFEELDRHAFDILDDSPGDDRT
jgi:cbb3-type cytochrome oxidase maturation protein